MRLFPFTLLSHCLTCQERHVLRPLLVTQNAQRELYPSPDICATSPQLGPRLLQFVGRMLGKAMWEGGLGAAGTESNQEQLFQ